MEWQQQSTREDQAVPPTSISVGPLSQSHMTALSPNWRSRCLMDGLCSGEGIGWMVNGSMSRWRLVTRGVPQGSVLGLALINTFISNTDSEIKGTLSKLADNTELSRVSDTAEGKDGIQGWHQIALEHKLSFVTVQLCSLPPLPHLSEGCRAAVSGNSRRGCPVLGEHPQTSHTLAHQSPLVPRSTCTLVELVLRGPSMARWEPHLGFQAGDRAGESFALREGGGIQSWPPMVPLVAWVGSVGGSPMWGFSGQLRLINVVILVIGGELVRLFKAGAHSPIYFAREKCVP